MLAPPHSSANKTGHKITTFSGSAATDPYPCYKGDVEDCNRDRKSIAGGCLLWHFHPDMGRREMEERFNLIMESHSLF